MTYGQKDFLRLVILGAFLILALMFAVGCGPSVVYTNAPEDTLKVTRLSVGVERFHDPNLPATCWITHSGYGIGISCIPDSQLKGGGTDGEGKVPARESGEGR